MSWPPRPLSELSDAEFIALVTARPDDLSGEQLDDLYIELVVRLDRVTHSGELGGTR